MNIKDFLIDNYIYIIVVIVLIIITIIGFLADKKKNGVKKVKEDNGQNINNQNISQINPANNGIANPINMPNIANQQLNNAVPTNSISNYNLTPDMVNTQLNQSIPNSGTITPNQVRPQSIVMPNQNMTVSPQTIVQQPNVGTPVIPQSPQAQNIVPQPINNIGNNAVHNNTGVTPIPVMPNNNVQPTPMPVTPNSQTSVNPLPNPQTGTVPNPMPSSVNQGPINFVYGQAPQNISNNGPSNQ